MPGLCPEPDYSEWGENDNEDWLNSSSPDTTPIDPEPTEPESTSQEDDTVTEKPTTDTGDEDPQLSTALKEITPLLKAKGIDLSKYKIQRKRKEKNKSFRSDRERIVASC